MIRATTPTHYFNIAFDTSEIKSCLVIYAQEDKEIITKHTEDCVFKDNTISTTLTQEETLLFDSQKKVQIQLRILTKGGAALVSYVKVVTVYRCLNDEVLT